MGVKLNHTSASVIKNLLVGHAIVAAEKDTFTLDNGTQLTVVPNYGCGGCTSGWYEIKDVDKFDQVITNVKLVETEITDPAVLKNFTDPHLYSIFVYAGKKTAAHQILAVSGDDGSGYYGTGYEITVKTVDEL